MRARRLVQLVAIAAIVLLVVGVSSVKGRSAGIARTPRVPIIDGSITPELIPDGAAFLMFFRALEPRGTPQAERRARAYVRYALARTAPATVSLDGHELLDDENATLAILSFALDATRQLKAFDSEANNVGRKFRDPLGERARLALVQRSKEIYLDGVIADLDDRLGASVAARLRLFINDNVKRRTRIY